MRGQQKKHEGGGGTLETRSKWDAVAGDLGLKICIRVSSLMFED